MSERTRLTIPERKQLANLVLDYLKDRSFPVETSTIVSNVLSDDAVFKTPEYNIRRTLARLEKCGVVAKVGVGRFRWSIVNKNWDRQNPYKPVKRPIDTRPLEEDEEDDDSELDVEEADKDEVIATVPRPPVVPTWTVPKSEWDVTQDRLNKLSEWRHTALLEIERLKKEVDNKISVVKELVIKKYDGKIIRVKDQVLPKEFDKVVALAQCRRNVLLIGPAGCGKTFLAKKVALALDLDFGSISCTAGMSETHLLGRSVPDLTHGKNRFQIAEFLHKYENGGLMLLDELDAADSNLLLALNTGLANDYMNVPNRPDDPRALRHKDFVCIATANTFGRGANRVYAGRNQLDESTLDRFRIGIVEMDYDKGVEKFLCPNIDVRTQAWVYRDKIQAAGLRRILSTRFLEDAQVMINHGWSKKDVFDTFFSGWSPEERAKVQ